MEQNNIYQQYRVSSINTLTPEELLILLYEELSLNINKAILFIKRKKVTDAHNNIIKAQNIVLYLIDILDLTYSISKDLLAIYRFMYTQLLKANILKDENILKQVLTCTNNLKATWQQAEKQIHAKTLMQERTI